MFSKGLLFHVPFQHLRCEESCEIVSAGSSQLALLVFLLVTCSSGVLLPFSRIRTLQAVADFKYRTELKNYYVKIHMARSCKI